MKRKQWKDWLESIGILAIVASLIFVGIETRNSTKQSILTTQALEIASYQDLMDNIAAMNSQTLENREVADLMYKAFRTTEDLTDFEKYRLEGALYIRFRHGDMAFFHFQRGAINEERLRSALQILNLGTPPAVDFWSRRKGNFVEPYRNYIDALIEEQNGLNSPD